MNASKPYNLLRPFWQQRKRNGYDINDIVPLILSLYSILASFAESVWTIGYHGRY
jgi:hypothetical protein